MIGNLRLILLSGLCTASAVCASPQPCVLPPPPEFWLTVQGVEPIESPLRVGQGYLIYVRRDTEGRFKESDDVSRSLSADRRRKAKTVSKPGQGDRGDRKR